MAPRDRYAYDRYPPPSYRDDLHDHYRRPRARSPVYYPRSKSLDYYHRERPRSPPPSRHSRRREHSRSPERRHHHHHQYQHHSSGDRRGRSHHSDRHHHHHHNHHHDHHKDHGSRRHRSSSVSNEKVNHAARAAFDAAAIEAIRQRNQPGQWTGSKGAKVATAAVGAAVTDRAIDRDPADKSKRHLVESTLGGLLANRVVNGSREDSRRREHGHRRR